MNVLVVNVGMDRPGRFGSDITLRGFDQAVYGESTIGQHRGIGMLLPQEAPHQMAAYQVVSNRMKLGCCGGQLSHTHCGIPDADRSAAGETKASDFHSLLGGFKLASTEGLSSEGCDGVRSRGQYHWKSVAYIE